ncbi:MAG TPA: type II toxin-antitoxin system VapC family toxin [Acetobacteraceae bacterium]
MILVDTSVWVDHLRMGDELLQDLLDRDQVLAHPFVIGELALGSIPQRAATLRQLLRLPAANVARHDEVMQLVEQQWLYGVGLGYADVHLLAATRLTSAATLWTRDKSLAAAADKLSLAARVTH